ncbi:Ribosomal_protein SA [Hexamita inflata]|uniref:Small ribosomal subunit protein uS2 n=1 Tax=Hexamita inflata TaxID=28002 RepID=A0AA86NKQ4_9EUKA|nr:Ribosomal protein SA [Hexamita inflata]
MSYTQLTQEDVTKLIIANAHIGHRGMEKSMQYYVFGRQKDGVYIFNIEKTFAKLQLAARLIATIKNPQDIVVIGAREESARAINKYCRHTGSFGIVGRYMPGTFTNRQAPTFREPQLIIVNDPSVDHQALLESAYANIPVVAFCNSDSKLTYVDIAIPCNNKGKRSVGLMYWMLCREVLRMKGAIKREDAWEMADTFIQLTEEDIKKMENGEEEEVEKKPEVKKQAKADFEDSDPFAQ